MNLHKKIEDILKQWNIQNYTINSDGSVDVKGDVFISNNGLKGKISDYVTFGVVSDNFFCSDNNLTSLDGAPKEVGGSFCCYNNQLTSLDGAPKKVGRNFFCSSNKLTSLEGAPKEVGGSFYCLNNRHFTEDDVREVSKVGGLIVISSYKKVKGVEPRHLIAHKMSLYVFNTLLNTNDIFDYDYYNWIEYKISESVYTRYKIFSGFKNKEFLNPLKFLNETRK